MIDYQVYDAKAIFRLFGQACNRQKWLFKEKTSNIPIILLIKSKAIILNVNVVWFWELVLWRGENWRELEILIGFCRFSDKVDELDKADGAASLIENRCELVLNSVVLCLVDRQEKRTQKK